MKLLFCFLLWPNLSELLPQRPEIVLFHDGTNGQFETAMEWPQRLVMVFRNLLLQHANFHLTVTTSLLYLAQFHAKDERKLIGLVTLARCGRGNTLQLVAKKMYPGIPLLRIDTEYCHEPGNILLTWVKTDFPCFLYAFQNWVDLINLQQWLSKLLPLQYTRTYALITNANSKCPVRLRFATHIADAYQSQYRNNILNGRVIRLGAYNSSFFLMYGNLSEPQNLKFRGVFADDMEILAFTLNYTFQLVIPKDQKLGAKTSNGSWDGLLGLASNNEIDFLGSAFNLFPDRLETVDWLAANYDNTFAFIIPPPDVKQNWLASAQPYHYKVWIYMIGCLVCLGLLAQFCDYIKRLTHPDLSKISWLHYIFDNIRVLLNQGANDANNHISNRIIMCVWCILALVATNLYTSVLTGYLTVPQVKPLISSLEQLAQSKDVRTLFVNNTSLNPVFTNPKATGTVAMISQRAREHPEDFFANSSGAIEQIAAKGWRVYTDSIPYAYAALAQDYQKHGRCRVSLIPFHFFTVPASYAVPKGSPYWHFFYIGGTRIVESGINKQMGKKLLQRSPCVDMMNIAPVSSSLHMTDLLSPYVLASIGIALSTIAFLSECCIKRMPI